MTGLVDSPHAQYAVLEVRRTEGPSERLVIAYPDEESLRELIAGPSIIACDFTSREEAQTNIDADFWTVAAWKETPRDRAEKYQHGVLSAKPRLGRGFDLTQTGTSFVVSSKRLWPGPFLSFIPEMPCPRQFGHLL